MTLQVIKDQSVISKIKVAECIKQWTLNFTDIELNNNKQYHCEVVKSDKNEFFIFTIYGRVGNPGVREYRSCSTQSEAEKEAEKIIKSKIKKGYVEVKLVSHAIGSAAGQAKIDKTVSVEALKKLGANITEQEEMPSKLHIQVQDLVRTWFGATQEFIELNLDTKKCPLGQLSVDQIDKAKQILEEARNIVHAKKPDTQELNKLTSQYYSNIPHVLGHRIDADMLRFDADTKIDKALDILDVFGDAKNVQAVISKRSAVDAQYVTLNAALDWVDPSDPTFKWLDTMLHETRASNHSALGKIKLHKVFRLARNDEDKHWFAASERIAKECGKSTPSTVYAKLLNQREDVPKDLQTLYKNANILPGWHGTRRANMIGITTKGLLVRPSGVVLSGSMYGPGCYFAVHSSKAINYIDVKGSCWAQGANKIGYLLLADVAFGNQKIVGASSLYTHDNIKPYHSVWAKSGEKSGLYNDELVTYVPTGEGQQHRLRYILEIETMVK